MAQLCAAREQIQAHAKIGSAEFTGRIRALQAWRENRDASVCFDIVYAAGRRRIREYLALLPGAELAYSE